MLEFAVPPAQNVAEWRNTLDELLVTQNETAAVIQEPESDTDRIPYHLIHGAYHLGRITQLRKMQGAPPTF